MTARDRERAVRDSVAYEAFGCLEGFAKNDKNCPQYIRDMVKEYQLRMEAAKAEGRRAREQEAAEAQVRG